MATKKLESYPSMINTLERTYLKSEAAKHPIPKNREFARISFFSLAPTKARWAKRGRERGRDKTTRSETILVTVIV